MRIDDLIKGFDALTPADEKKEEMLSNIMKAKEKKVVKIFDFKKVGMVAGALAAAVVLAVSIYSFNGVKVDDAPDYIAEVKEDNTSVDEGKNVAEDKASSEKAKPVKSKTKPKKTEIALAEPAVEKGQNVPDTAAEAPAASGGGSSGMTMRRSIGEDTVSDETSEGTAVPEKDSSGLVIVSEEDETNEVEWITVPSMEGNTILEENSGIEGNTGIEDEDEDESDEESEETEENEEAEENEDGTV